jgi:flagellar biosynthesis/type III secretory pathway protein FliH
VETFTREQMNDAYDQGYRHGRHDGYREGLNRYQEAKEHELAVVRAQNETLLRHVSIFLADQPMAPFIVNMGEKK